MLENWNVSWAINFELILRNGFFVLVLESRFDAAFLDDFIDLKHGLFSVINDETDLFGLLLILMFGTDRCAKIWTWISLKEFWINFNARDKFHDFLIFSWDVGVKGLLIFRVDLGRFGFVTVLVRLGRLVKFSFIEECWLIGFREVISDDNVLAFGLFALNRGQ